MIYHSTFENTKEGKQKLLRMIKAGNIVFGGNKNLKIYGRLHCSSGKRMLKKNRVFFAGEEEAVALGYRPCGHCMKKAYEQWKAKKA